MLQKIKAFFGCRGIHRVAPSVGLTDLQQQIDIATEIIAVLDKARETGAPVKIIFSTMGAPNAGMVCMGKHDETLNWLYQTVSALRVSRAVQLNEQNERIWNQVEQKLDADGEGKRPNWTDLPWTGKVPPEK
jgi:hypothetical protein